MTIAPFCSSSSLWIGITMITSIRYVILLYHIAWLYERKVIYWHLQQQMTFGGTSFWKPTTTGMTCEMLHNLSHNGTIHSPILNLNMGTTECTSYYCTRRLWWYVFLNSRHDVVACCLQQINLTHIILLLLNPFQVLKRIIWSRELLGTVDCCSILFGGVMMPRA
jgi:hypothetical protein